MNRGWHGITGVLAGTLSLILLHTPDSRADIAPALGRDSIYGPLNGPTFGPYHLAIILAIAITAVFARAALAGIRAIRRKHRAGIDGAAPDSGAAESTRRGSRILREVLYDSMILFIAAIVIPNFMQFRMSSKVSEVHSCLSVIRSLEVAYFAEWNVWVGNQQPTPSGDRRGKDWWEHWDPGTRFSVIGFAPDSGKVFCSYSLEGPDWSREGFAALAECDFDGDGKTSMYRVTNADNEIRKSGAPF